MRKTEILAKQGGGEVEEEKKQVGHENLSALTNLLDMLGGEVGVGD